MKKRILAIVLAACMVAAVCAGCAGDSSASSKAPSTAASGTTSGGEERKVLEYNAVFVISKERVPDSPSLLDDYMLENFGIKMNWEQMASSSVEEKLPLLFAGKTLPDMVWPVGVVAKFPKKFGQDGLLLPINEYFDQLPNYRKLYSDEEWATLLMTESNADGNLYYLPQKNYRATAASWIYRKSAFDQWGLTFPKTTDELYDVLKTIKEKDPSAVPMPNSGGLNVLDGLYLAWGIQRDSFINDKGELVPYGRATDEYREVLKYAAKLWKEGLINKEFATVTEQQWTEQYANGKAYIQYSYATRVPWAEENMKKVDPSVKFDYVPQNVTADESKGYYWSKESSYTTAGPFFTTVMAGEKMDRMMEWYDWLCTEEGSLFINMGTKGVTYEIVDGEPQFMAHMYHATRNPDGTKDWKYGLYLGNIVQHPAYLKETGKETDLQVSETLLGDKNGHYFAPVAWTFSEADEKKINDYDTAIKDVADEYAMKFIMGQLDPNKDADWEAYLKTLDGVGLKEASALRQANFKIPK